MWNEIYDYREETSKKYCYSLRHTIEIDFIPFMDQIAAEIGCKPDIGRTKLFYFEFLYLTNFLI
jgi:dimethylaniline monooxygenase (N-oxide forming)